MERNCSPAVSVVMPAYNAERFLTEAIDSILAQSLKDFELIIINDASADLTKEIIMSCRAKDPRIIYLENETNLGVHETLNAGLHQARGEFIARMDADDIAEPQRLEKQVTFLRSNSDAIVCGTFLQMIDETGRVIGKRIYETTDAGIKKGILRGSPFAHPSVMIRRETLAAHALRYSGAYPYAEDYDLWLRLMSFGKFFNLGEPLLRYRLSDQAVKNRHCKTALRSTIRLKCKYLNHADLISWGILLAEMILLSLPKSWILYMFKKLHGER